MFYSFDFCFRFDVTKLHVDLTHFFRVDLNNFSVKSDEAVDLVIEVSEFGVNKGAKIIAFASLMDCCISLSYSERRSSAE